MVRNSPTRRIAATADDSADIDESTRVWVDHNDFSSVGLTGDKDTYDGLLDAKHGADSLTFSWNKFHDHVSPLRPHAINPSNITIVEGLPRRSLRQQRC